ncbi:unnamed protein product, partial [Ectocarpus fasciculatus]
PLTAYRPSHNGQHRTSCNLGATCLPEVLRRLPVSTCEASCSSGITNQFTSLLALSVFFLCILSETNSSFVTAHLLVLLLNNSRSLPERFRRVIAPDCSTNRRPFIPIGLQFTGIQDTRKTRRTRQIVLLAREKRSGFALLLPMRKGRKGKEVVSRAFCSRQERSKKLRFTLLLPTSKGRKEGRKEEVSRSPFCRKEGRRGSISRSFFPRGEEE